jgi:hypothetical protein
MTNINITSTSPVTVDVLNAKRLAVGDALASSYGAMREYAQTLCSVLPAEWYLVEHADTSDNAKPVHAEKKALFVVLKAAQHSNPSTIWARVRKYAQEYIEGAPTKGEAGEASEAESEGGNTRETRSLARRYIEELTTLYKAGKRAESLSDKESEALTKIGGALIALGVDLSML